ncbi:hypothetical protein GCM10027275_35560 [Rhabdobacter roseus]
MNAQAFFEGTFSTDSSVTLFPGDLSDTKYPLPAARLVYLLVQQKMLDWQEVAPLHQAKAVSGQLFVGLGHA